MKSRRSSQTILLCLVCLASTACMKDTVAFHTATRLAIEIQTSEEQPGVNVGYRRLEGVTMPLRVSPDGADGTKDGKGNALVPDAYPVLAGFMTSSSGLWPNGARPLGTRIKQVFATGRAAKQLNAPAAVISALDAKAAPLVGMPSREGSRLGRELLKALDEVPDERQAAAFAVLTEELDAPISDRKGARAAVQDRAGTPGSEARLERALGRIRVLQQE